MDTKIRKFTIYKSKKNLKEIENLKMDSNSNVVDRIQQQFEELWKIRNPGKKLSSEDLDKMISLYTKGDNIKNYGNWIYYPWNKTFIHILEDELYQEVRTSRNRELISVSEQKQFEQYIVGIAGLSIGNSIATNIRMQGGSKSIKVSDSDTLELSNINRIRTGIVNYNISKTEVCRRELLEIDPYSIITVYKNGLGIKNISDFFNKINVVFDEVDDLHIKIMLRTEAKKRKTPLIMITDNDDGILIDYYPYHRSLNTPFFYNVDDLEVLRFANNKEISKGDVINFAKKIVGPENISNRMKNSLECVGRTLYTWPQLGTAALQAGVAGSFLARHLAVEGDIPFTRKVFKINNLINVTSK